MAPLTPAQILKSIRDLYLLLEQNLSTILTQCTTKAERDRAVALYSSARDAFWKAHSTVLEDNNLTVKEIHKDLGAATKNIKGALAGIQNIASFLKLVTEGVRLAGALAALAAAA